MPGWDCPARPAVYKAPIGAQVASPQSPILRWSTSRISALTLRTRGTKQKSGFDSTSGFANYKVSGFANYSCPVLLAPRHHIITLTPQNSRRDMARCAIELPNDSRVLLGLIFEILNASPAT